MPLNWHSRVDLRNQRGCEAHADIAVAPPLTVITSTERQSTMVHITFLQTHQSLPAEPSKIGSGTYYQWAWLEPHLSSFPGSMHPLEGI